MLLLCKEIICKSGKSVSIKTVKIYKHYRKTTIYAEIRGSQSGFQEGPSLLAYYAVSTGK